MTVHPTLTAGLRHPQAGLKARPCVAGGDSVQVARQNVFGCFVVPRALCVGPRFTANEVQDMGQEKGQEAH